MSSACTCHINPEQCWWCLYEVEKAKVQQYKEMSLYLLDIAEKLQFMMLKQEIINDLQELKESVDRLGRGGNNHV